ncbi:MAG: hypothetical protein E7214_06930 [Clostridium sp.]|nr:hypothetical protein [Clostridium sp.]
MSSIKKYSGHTILSISDSLANEVSLYAKHNNRRILSLADIENGSNEGIETVTVVGELDDFNNDIIGNIINMNVPVSIITADSKKNIFKYMSKVKDKTSIKINSVLIEDFIENNVDKSQTYSKLKQNDACLFVGHGDYLCVNLQFGILCSKENIESNNKCTMIPKCIKSGKCFRLERLGNSGEVLNVKDIAAKFLFVNTCSGISFKGRKYKDYNLSLMTQAINNNCYVYISNYIIGYYTVEEVKIYHVLLSTYGNFAKATFYFNTLIKQFLRKSPTAIMVGDASLNAIFLEKYDEQNSKCEVVYINEDYVEIKFNSKFINNGNVFSIDEEIFKKNDFDLLNTIPIDKNSDWEYTLGIYYDGKYNIVVYSEKEYFDNSIIFYKEDKLNQKIQSILDELEKCKFINDFILSNDYIESNIKKIEYLKRSLNEFKYIQSNLKLNIEKFTFLTDIIIECRKFLKYFKIKFLKEYLEYSMKSDTHLMLNTLNMHSDYLFDSKEVCYICNSAINIMKFNSINSRRVYYKRICPNCEIYSVSSTDKDVFRLTNINIDQDKIVLEYSLDLLFKDIKLGIVVINTGIASLYEIEDTNELMDNVFSVKLDKTKKQGLYYLRSILISGDEIFLLNNQIYFGD